MRKSKLYYITSIVSAYSVKGAISQSVGEVVKVTLEGEPELITAHESAIKQHEKQNKIGFTNSKE